MNLTTPTAEMLAPLLPTDPGDVLALIVNAKAKADPGAWPGTVQSTAVQRLTLDMAIEAFGDSNAGVLLRLIRQAEVAAYPTRMTEERADQVSDLCHAIGEAAQELADEYNATVEHCMESA